MTVSSLALNPTVLTEHLKLIVLCHYPHDSLALGDAPLQDTLPGLSDDELGLPGALEVDLGQLAVAICAELTAQREGQLSSARALAQIAVRVSGYLHSRICSRRAESKGYGRRRACRRDIRAASDVVATSANPYCGLDLDRSLFDVAYEQLRADGLDQEDLIAAVEAALAPLLHPRWDTRQLIAVDASRPIIQINTAITHMPNDAYSLYRSLAMILKSAVEARGWIAEVTSDYAAPTSLGDTLVDETLTRGGIYRASGMLLFTDHGGPGTITTWNLAEDLLIPTLVLEPTGKEVVAARYPGHLYSRNAQTYSALSEVCALAMTFLDEMEWAILERARKIASYADQETGHLTASLQRVDVSAFDGSSVTFELARFVASDPVVWFQTRPPIAQEVRRILGVTSVELPAIGRASSTVSPPVTRRNAVDARSIRALHTAAELEHWEWEWVDRLLDVYLDQVASRPLSQVERSWDVQDWRSASRNLDESGT